MSLRDLFAVSAMAAIITNHSLFLLMKNDATLANSAFVLADAMLAERAKAKA